MTFGDFSIDQNQKKLTKNNNEIILTSMEYKLLIYLVENKNRVITKNQLFREVWNDFITSDGTLNVHIRRLREKIENDPNNPKFIKTIWGTGYIFEG